MKSKRKTSSLDLLFLLIQRELKERFLGSALGTVWIFLQPLCLIAVYVIVFGFIFQSKVPLKLQGPNLDSQSLYLLWLLSGLIPQLVTADSLQNTTTSLIRSASLVKTTALQTQLLSVAASLSSVGMWFVGCTALVVVKFVCMGFSLKILITVLLGLTFLGIIQFLLLAGIGFFLSATTVFLRDVQQTLGTILMMTMFLTPIFYSMDSLPSWAQQISFLNPFHQMIDGYRNILLLNTLPSTWGILYLSILSIVLFMQGRRYFLWLKPHLESNL